VISQKENIMKIVVVGGGGLIGSKLVKKLQVQGHAVVAASPRFGVNTITGQGLAGVLQGAAVVVDVSNSPTFEAQAVMKFFQTSTRNLLTHELAAGVGHHVVLSVVGVDRPPQNAYFQAKLAQEKLIQESSIPYSILRATQFFEFFPAIADSLTAGNQVRLPAALIQPIAADDVVAALGKLTIGKPVNGIIEIGGPERFTFEEFIRQGLGARNDGREIIVDPKAGYFGAPINEQTLLTGDNAQISETHFKTWLKTGSELKQPGAHVTT
jgi:uncharacterized protein YbjT (DUF2867 family)